MESHSKYITRYAKDMLHFIFDPQQLSVKFWCMQKSLSGDSNNSLQSSNQIIIINLQLWHWSSLGPQQRPLQERWHFWPAQKLKERDYWHFKLQLHKLLSVSFNLKTDQRIAALVCFAFGWVLESKSHSEQNYGGSCGLPLNSLNIYLYVYAVIV